MAEDRIIRMWNKESENELTQKIHCALSLGISPESIGATLMVEGGIKADGATADTLEQLIALRMKS